MKEKKLLNKHQCQPNEDTDDSDDDKPFRVTLATTSTALPKTQSPNVLKGLSSPVHGSSHSAKTKVSIKKSDKDLKDDISLSSKFQLKIMEVHTVRIHDFDDDKARKMQHCSQWWLLSLAVFLLAFTVQANENGVKTAVFLSPKFELGAGQVEDKYYLNVDFPRGHIAIKEFNGEVVDELGNPVPLHETYLHHWVVRKYYAPKGVEVPENNGDHQKLDMAENIRVRNAGVCQGDVLGQYFGIGSETRKTTVYIPNPYGIEIGNPAEIPSEYEERWMLNVHAIDTRGVVDRMGCTECRCDLYNLTRDEHGRPFPSGYVGGLKCCHDKTQCMVQEGFENIKRSLYLRYTVKWVDWEDTIVPVKIYILDVTDDGKRVDHGSTEQVESQGCKVEYDVESCNGNDLENNRCIDTKRASIVMPHGGDVIYGVAHQHSGGLGSTLFREDGQPICSSIAIYGEGEEAGNEAGYIVGMTSCYIQPGTVRISDKETLILESYYNSTQKHTGVMCLFYILVADSPPKHVFSLAILLDALKMLSVYQWAIVFIGVIATVIGTNHAARKMQQCSQWWLLSLAIFLLALTVQANENGVKTAVFLSPKFELGAGQVEDKIYLNIDFPRGHVAIKEFNGEVVDELGNPVPLHETYLHHWVVGKYYAPKVVDEVPEGNGDHHKLHKSKHIRVRNAGVCQGDVLGQYFGIGSETRKTKVYIPDPYGIEIGNPAEISSEYEERWLLNVHAIDTRGVVDRMGCTECRCDLYNITKDEHGRPFPSEYVGGLRCCHDKSQCMVQEGFENIKRSLYLRYTVKWVDWEDTIVPVKIYIFDVEYDVEPCNSNDLGNNGCIDTKRASIVMPHGGEVIYGVAHQHSGGLSSTLFKEDGQAICSSIAIYGEGEEPGNEAGYIVGMTSCYIQPGTVRVFDKETLILESYYNSTQKHTGVMGLFYILVADSPPKHVFSLATLLEALKMLSLYQWALIFVGVAAAVFGVHYLRRNRKEGSYQSINRAVDI
ncbi:hypothetical protein NE237_000860 [Protea cynaroides]|uniref:Uncharacterized protein n=1 Tax=Protea cynaroides TaxID=273540 RepID=A0A9Q0KSD6_9MAGN|nr:hypothetical protein NE237_000860 [Protea cynaroides]